jgi:hypothetical protein
MTDADLSVMPSGEFLAALGIERRMALITLGSLVVGACATGGALLPREQSSADVDRNKANYLAAKAAYNARDLNGCLDYYAPDHQIMSKPVPPGRQHIRAFFEGSFATWPDI